MRNVVVTVAATVACLVAVPVSAEVEPAPPPTLQGFNETYQVLEDIWQDVWSLDFTLGQSSIVVVDYDEAESRLILEPWEFDGIDLPEVLGVGSMVLAEYVHLGDAQDGDATASSYGVSGWMQGTTGDYVYIRGMVVETVVVVDGTPFAATHLLPLDRPDAAGLNYPPGAAATTTAAQTTDGTVPVSGTICGPGKPDESTRGTAQPGLSD